MYICIKKTKKNDFQSHNSSASSPQGTEENPVPVSLRYEDGYHYQNVFGPLVKMESDYDKGLIEAQRKENVAVRWELALNKKHVGYFVFPRRVFIYFLLFFLR